MSKETNRIIRQSTKEVKRAYKKLKSKASTVSASQQRRWERSAELERRAEAIREGEQRKKKRKAERAKKEQRDREARERMGMSLPPQKGLYISPRQMRISALFRVESATVRKEASKNTSPTQLNQDTSTTESSSFPKHTFKIPEPKQDTSSKDNPSTPYTVEDSYGLSDDDVKEAVASYSTQRPAEAKRRNIPSSRGIYHTSEKATQQTPAKRTGRDASKPVNKNHISPNTCEEALEDEDILAAISSSGRLLEASTPAPPSGSRAAVDKSVELPDEQKRKGKGKRKEEKDEESYGLSDEDPEFEQSALLELIG